MLKKIVIASIFPILLFSTEVHFKKTFTKTVNANEIKSTITLKMQRDIEDDIIPTLEKYEELILSDDTVNKNKNKFTVNPNYLLQNNTSKIKNYHGVLSYTIFATDSIILNTFVKELLDAKDEKNISLQVSSPIWFISHKKKEKISNTLRYEAIQWANTYAVQLSSELSLNCISKKVDFISTNKSKKLLSPSSSNQMSLKANYTMECL